MSGLRLQHSITVTAVGATSVTVNVGVSSNTSAHTFISQELMQLDTIQEQRLPATLHIITTQDTEQ